MFQWQSGLSRRGFLGHSAAMGAFMLPQVSPVMGATRAGSSRPPRCARSVIMLLLEGGMSHLDTWDPKPDAPAEVRGAFGQIHSSNPDLIVGEHTPLLARQAHLYNIVRTVYSENARRDHSPGLHWVLTGYDNQAAGVALMRVNKDPSVGSVVAHELGSLSPEGLPNFVAVPNRTQLGGRVNYNGALHLGAACDAFDSGSVPARADSGFMPPVGLVLPKHVPIGRLEDRDRLLRSVDTLRRDRDRFMAMEKVSQFQRQAMDLLVGGRGEAAFDINAEPPKVREMYGNSKMGQATLLARRLVEAGVTYVLVNYSRNNSWDTHTNNFKRLENSLLPPMDRAASALLVDLERRGLLDDVLVVMMGEMGRTPVINKQSGRDHWTDVNSIMLAGGGLTRGRILGHSNRLGQYPANRPVHLREVLAMVYHQLGIDPKLAITDAQGRPTRILPDAEPIGELIQG